MQNYTFSASTCVAVLGNCFYPTVVFSNIARLKQNTVLDLFSVLRCKYHSCDTDQRYTSMSMRQISVKVLKLILIGLMVTMNKIGTASNIKCYMIDVGDGSGCFVEKIKKLDHEIKHTIELQSSDDPRVTLTIQDFQIISKF